MNFWCGCGRSAIGVQTTRQPENSLMSGPSSRDPPLHTKRVDLAHDRTYQGPGRVIKGRDHGPRAHGHTTTTQQDRASRSGYPRERATCKSRPCGQRAGRHRGCRRWFGRGTAHPPRRRPGSRSMACKPPAAGRTSALGTSTKQNTRSARRRSRSTVRAPASTVSLGRVCRATPGRADIDSRVQVRTALGHRPGHPRRLVRRAGRFSSEWARNGLGMSSPCARK